MLRRVVRVVPCSSPAAVGWRTPHQWLTCWLGSHIAILCRISPPKPGASSMHLGEKLPCDAKKRDADGYFSHCHRLSTGWGCLHSLCPVVIQGQSISAAHRLIMFPLQHFRTSVGMLSFPGAFPESRKSRSLFNSSRAGSLWSSCNTGRHLMTFSAFSVTTISLRYNSEYCCA